MNIEEMELQKLQATLKSLSIALDLFEDTLKAERLTDKERRSFLTLTRKAAS